MGESAIHTQRVNSSTMMETWGVLLFRGTSASLMALWLVPVITQNAQRDGGVL